MNGTTEIGTNEREVLRCKHCKLVQFSTYNRHCRKCGRHIALPAPEANQEAGLKTSGTLPPMKRAKRLPTTLAEQIAANVKAQRSRADLSQRQLGELAGLQRTYISKVESGRALPALPSLERLGKAMGISVAAFLLPPVEDALLAELAGYLPRLSTGHLLEILRTVRLMAREHMAQANMERAA